MPIQVSKKGEIITEPNPAPAEIHSEAIREIVSGRPDFISRWGLLFFVGIIAVVLVTSWFVHYPEIITTRAVLIGTNAPGEVLTPQDGRMVKIFARNNDTVKAGDILAWMESAADHQQVLLLSRHLDSILVRMRQQRRLEIAGLLRLNLSELGELQTDYQQFVAANQQFIDYQPGGFFDKKATLLRSDAGGIEKTLDNLKREKHLLEQDLALTEQNEKADDLKSKLLDKKISIRQITGAILSSQAQQRDKQKEIAGLDHDFSIEATVFQQAIQTLQSAVEDWRRKYLVTAAISGRLSLVYPVQENQFVHNGLLLGYINPGGGNFYAKINLPQDNSGKAQVGQQVQLRLDAFPYNEFGYVSGRLEFISDVATDSGFQAFVRLPDGLVTNRHIRIPCKSGLRADAVIITKEMRLLERLFYGLAKVMKQ